ncbi:Metallo-dependent phosphatase-like protein [Crassisporium funariophilum]|nr:Metallo-dependent phosphatase-like protein [Crassisporium funariophilum]
MTTSLPILHFNDVYRVTQKFSSSNADTTIEPETIDVAQFAALIDDLRDRWAPRPDESRDGLVLFSGDVFSPSVESSVTRGSHMVPVLNQLKIDVSVTGNHDFDFGYPHLSKLVQDTTFPWILSNIIDTNTNRIPEHLQEFVVIERAAVRVGIIGLVEQEWITTVASWPSEFVYKSMKETGLELSERLRDPDGEYRCDLVIALTHSRLPNDINVAKELFALSPTAQTSSSIAEKHGVDLLLGGHDHLYFVAHGVNSWEDFDKSEKVLGAELDNGDVLVIKSGSDFRDLSEINLELEATPEGSIRRKVIANITGKRHVVLPGMKSSPPMSTLLETLLSSVGSTLKAPVCKTTTMIDVRSTFIRVTESAVANWFADIARHAYDDALCMQGSGGSDAVLLCAGTFRGDSTYGPGLVTIGDILEILPFADPIVVLEVDGATLWDALESSLQTWPAQEGRFPAISGLRVSWDSRKEPGHRVLGIWLLASSKGNKENKSSYVEEVPVKRETGGRTYKLVTREYMAQGHDGFAALTRGKWLIDHECGSIMSSIVRKYLLGSQFVNRLIRMKNQPDLTPIHERTKAALLRESHAEEAGKLPSTNAARHWHNAFQLAVHHGMSAVHYQDHLSISASEHMSAVDFYDGSSVRKGRNCAQISLEDDPDLLVVSPAIDGRLKNEGQSVES